MFPIPRSSISYQRPEDAPVPPKQAFRHFFRDPVLEGQPYSFPFWRECIVSSFPPRSCCSKNLCIPMEREKFFCELKFAIVHEHWQSLIGRLGL